MNIELLYQHFPNLEVRENVPYREITTLGVGTTLPVLALPNSDQELSDLLKFLHRKHIASFIFGAGSNLIGMDAPYPGLGIKLGDAFNHFALEEHRLIAGARCKLPQLARYAAEAGEAGLSELGGIPGSIGGALKMNAGTAEREIGPLVREVKGFHADGTPYQSNAEELVWGYRTSSIPRDVVITEATFELQPSTAEVEQTKLKQELDRRKAREPQGRSAGCTFRNVSRQEPAGKLIDEANLRGFEFGGMKISEKHANYILAPNGGSEADYMQLIRLIRRTIAEKHGFYLRHEVCFVNPQANAMIARFIAPLKVTVLCGGNSSEREVSLHSGDCVARALDNCGFDVTLTDLKKCEVVPSMLQADAVFPILHGGFGEDGHLQSLMEKNRIKFVGSDSVASALVMDKIATKQLLDRFHLATAKWTTVTKAQCAVPENLKFPLILKVPGEGSSVGIIKVDTQEQWPEAVQKELKIAPQILAEEFIDGVEITVPVVGGKALDTIEIRAPHGFYDYDAKYLYKNGHTQYLCPPESITPEVSNRARQIAENFSRFSGCRDMLRVDFIVGKDDIPYILEGNSLPGFTATSLVPKAAAAAGISFERLTSSMIYAALKRRAELPETAPSRNLHANPKLVGISRFMYRLLLVLCAALLLVIARNNQGLGVPLWPLYTAAVLLVVSEIIFTGLGKLIKK